MSETDCALSRSLRRVAVGTRLSPLDVPTLDDAADEIDRLRAEVARLKDVLATPLPLAGYFRKHHEDCGVRFIESGARNCTCGARAFRQHLEAALGEAPSLARNSCEGGFAVRWCPKCGTCTCPNQDQSPEDWLTDDSCPIHSDQSQHGEAPAPPRVLSALVDLLNVISADDLIPETVSYMRQAHAAVARAKMDGPAPSPTDDICAGCHGPIGDGRRFGFMHRACIAKLKRALSAAEGEIALAQATARPG